MPKNAIAFVATAKPDESLAFYRDVLGLTLLEDTPFAIVFDAFGTMLRVQKAEQVVKAPYTAFGIDVDDIQAEVERLRERGVSLVRYPHLPQDDTGIWSTPGGTKIAWFHDPDGNVLSLTELRG